MIVRLLKNVNLFAKGDMIKMENKGKIGYSYWGFLADYKFDSNGNFISTPDGNAFYSWCIIKGLQDAGYDVLQVLSNRDKNYENLLRNKGIQDNTEMFNSWVTKDRVSAYNDMIHNNITNPIEGENIVMYRKRVYSEWDRIELNNAVAVIHEWRMLIPGRNSISDYCKEGFQPDNILQDFLFDYCDMHNVPVILFDLDYKLTEADIARLSLTNKNLDVAIFELGFKWYNLYRKSMHVEIPFDFSHIHDFDIVENPYVPFVYVGNRYERDYVVDKYIPDIQLATLYGNWLESGRDSKERWPGIKFGPRLQTGEMHAVYSDAVATILLAKQEYFKYNFMTARIIESVFYGCVPLFVEEYGLSAIERYAGIYADMLTVASKDDVVKKIKYFSENKKDRVNAIKYLRNHLAQMMDIKNFVHAVEYTIDKFNRGRW